MFMNEWDIEEAVRRHRNHPVLGKATRFLAAFCEEVNRHSDGWPYWTPPIRSAAKLMTLIQGDAEQATEAAFNKALVPIRSFYTRRGTAAGMQFPKEETT